MKKLTEEVWQGIPALLKNKVINHIDETLHFQGQQLYSSGICKPFGEKPKLRLLSTGRWILTNTCVNWGLLFDFEIAIHWADHENLALKDEV